MTTPLVPFSSAPMTSIETYMYGLKKRAHEHHCLVHGTFPVEMEKLAALRKVYSKQVRPVTLLPFFIKAIALSVKENPGVNRILFRRFPWGRRIVSFNVVDVNVPITRKIGDEMVQFIGTIRGADALTVGQIQDAIEAMQRGNPLESPYIQKVIKLKSSPPFVAKLFHWLMTWSPKFYLKNAGTCSITTLDGMRGDHFFSVGPTTSLFCIGGIGDEAVVRDGAVVARRMMKAALALDNYVVGGLDGVLLARAFQAHLEDCVFVEAELGAAAVVAIPSAKPSTQTSVGAAS